MKTTQLRLTHVLLLLLTALLTTSVVGDAFKTHGDLKIFYSAFPSTVIPAEIASASGIIRGVDRGVVNIAAVKKLGTGLPIIIYGEFSNIMQQTKKLDFTEIQEGSTVYYIAPFEFDNEDFLTFKIRVKTDSAAPAYAFKFQKIMYVDK